MIDVHVHYRGAGTERRRLPAIPAVGCYVFGPGTAGRLFQVAAVVVDGDGVDVFALQVSPRLASELQEVWATWGQSSGTVGDRAGPGASKRVRTDMG